MKVEQQIYIYKQEGYSFFNTGTPLKKSVTKWGTYMERKPTDQEIEKWLSFRSQNWGIVCGEISNTIILDIDTKKGADPEPFLKYNLRTVQTPSGGYHVYIKYDPLLKDIYRGKESDEGMLKSVDIQTNGTFVFAPPSKFENGDYKLINDVPVKECPPELMAEILAEIELEKQVKTTSPYIGPKDPESKRPGDIFNALAKWEDILIPHGWELVYRSSEGVGYWSRPGKRKGISASTDYKGYGLFYPFTTSTELDPRRGYTKFNLYTQLNHDGDFRKAAKALVYENYKRVMGLK